MACIDEWLHRLVGAEVSAEVGAGVCVAWAWLWGKGGTVLEMDGEWLCMRLCVNVRAWVQECVRE